MCKKILIYLIFFLLLKVPKSAAEMQTRVVKATAYCMGTIGAWGDRVHVGVIAVSRDLEAIGLDKGVVVHVSGIGECVVKDRMPWQKNHIDIYMLSKKRAKKFGKKRLKISWHKKNSGRRRHHNSSRRRVHE